MSAPTTFLLTASQSTLPPSEPLHLLPFSLGPNNNPYKSNKASTSSYFQPRPCPSGDHNPVGIPIAAFRGRTIVGQSIQVPRGYRGIILATGKRPDQGGVEVRNISFEEPHSVNRIRGRAKVGQIPLTPASSIDSAASSSSSSQPLLRNGNRAQVQVQARGLNQIAYARPRTRQTQPEAKKRFRLDSDSDNDSHSDTEEAGPGSSSVQPSRILRTPSKRAKTTASFKTPIKTAAAAATRTPVKSGTLPTPVPSITVQAPTPLKTPLPRPLVRLPRHRILDAEIERGVQGSPSPEPECASAYDGLEEEMLIKEEVEESVIPSPATEEDPPPFHIGSKVLAASSSTSSILSSGSAELDGDGSVRALRPVAEFDGFTLWTPDAPLPGFRADELEIVERLSIGHKDEGEAKLEGEGEEEDQGKEEGEGNIEGGTGGKAARGWWRTGGAGEGGDEFVRALGEWLGLVESLNRPVYLDGLNDSDGDDEDTAERLRWR